MRSVNRPPADAGVMGRPRSTKKGKNKENQSPESSNKPAKLRSWSNESMLKAKEAVKDVMGVNRAPLEHEVPRITLKDRISGRVIHGTNSGPKPYLTRVEEEELRLLVLSLCSSDCDVPMTQTVTD